MNTATAAATVICSLILMFANACLAAQARILEPDDKLSKGEVVVGHTKVGDVEYVVGRIRIHQPPNRVWPILSNPYEFEEKISPKFHTENIMKDRPDLSIISCRIDIGFFLPPVHYTVESRYENGSKITFQSLGGDLKDFRGCWAIEPVAGGRECDVVYSMYCQPGIPIPQFIVRQGIKIELPHTLIGLRDRIQAIYGEHEHPVARSIAASNVTSAAGI